MSHSIRVFWGIAFDRDWDYHFYMLFHSKQYIDKISFLSPVLKMAMVIILSALFQNDDATRQEESTAFLREERDETDHC